VEIVESKCTNIFLIDSFGAGSLISSHPIFSIVYYIYKDIDNVTLYYTQSKIQRDSINCAIYMIRLSLKIIKSFLAHLHNVNNDEENETQPFAITKKSASHYCSIKKQRLSCSKFIIGISVL
jgi:hypothetical protein